MPLTYTGVIIVSQVKTFPTGTLVRPISVVTEVLTCMDMIIFTFVNICIAGISISE